MPLTLDLTDQFIRDYEQLLQDLERAKSRPAADPGTIAARDKALADLHHVQLQLAELRDANESLRAKLDSQPKPGACPQCADTRQQLAAAQTALQAERQKADDLLQRLKQTKTASDGSDEALGNLQAEVEERDAEIIRLGEKIVELEQTLFTLRQKK